MMAELQSQVAVVVKKEVKEMTITLYHRDISNTDLTELL